MTPTDLFRVLGLTHTLRVMEELRVRPRRSAEVIREVSSRREVVESLRELLDVGLVERLAGSMRLYSLTPRGREILKLTELFDDFEEAARAEQANPFWEMSPSQREAHRRFLEAVK